MTPRSARFHRILPFALPALLALILAAWVFQRGVAGRQSGAAAEGSAAAAAARAGDGNAAGSRFIAETLADAARAADRLQPPAEPPANPAVAQLLQCFESGDRKVPEPAIRELVSRPLGKHVTVRAGGIEWSGILDSRSDEGETVHVGVTLDDGLGRFQLSLREDDKVQASLLFNGESHAFAFRGLPENGHWTLEATTVARILCTPAGSIYPVARGQAAMPLAGDPARPGKPSKAPVGAPPVLNSNPGSPFVIYCDFDGEVVTHPLWNDGATIDAAPHARADDAVFVTRVWERVSEDYAPFNINVTTDRTVYDSAAESRRVMCVVTPTDTAAPGAGGVAYLGSFGYGIPCWAFNDTEAACADTISHEVGHTVGLAHDGIINGFAYYGGHGVGPTSWAPLMGAYFADFEPPMIEEEVTQFSKGEYPQADNQEDDLAIITSSNGFTYRKDDKGNSAADASALSISRGKVSDSGIVERTNDADWFSFATSGGEVTLNVNVTDIQSTDDPQRGSNLAASAELLNLNGKRVAFSSPQDSLDASIVATLKPGNYFLKIDGAGRGDLATGFSDYASIGQYAISGSVPQDGILTVSPTTLEFPRVGGSGIVTVSAGGKWSWSVDQDWVVSNEQVNQKGDQTFDYSVPRNGSRNPRTANITFTDGTFIGVHTITQKGSEGDDHGDIIEEATLVEQDSVTKGNLEVEDDIDMFRIDVRGFGNLTVRTTGGTDTYGELLDTFGSRIASNDNARKPNFSLTRPVATGIYYVAVRHAHQGGFGPYELVCKFEPGPALAIDPAQRIVGPGGGRYVLRVISNTAWSWKSNASWVSSTSATSQSDGQAFDYEIEPNSTGKRRTATIAFRGKGISVVHRIVQNASDGDDHGDTIDAASQLAANGESSGRIEFEGDVDLFRVVLPTSGDLTVATTGTMDSYGQLLDSKGKVLVSNDDGAGNNFAISEGLSAGTYFVKVRHFSENQLGAYGLTSSFTPSALIDVRYLAGEGGSIRGPKNQKVPLGGTARRVTAVPKAGYSFRRWSDGVRTAAREDRNLSNHLETTARFVPTLSVKTANGEPVANNQTPPVDFGIVARNESRKKTFTLRNNGTRTLTNLSVTKSGSQPAAWSSSPLSKKTLKPGQSAKLTVTLKPDTVGYKGATFTIAASGIASSFQLRVMGFVENAVIVGVDPLPPVIIDPPVLGATAPGATVRPLGAAAPQTDRAAALPDWLPVAKDGFFHHRFLRPHGKRAESSFWISTNGTDWEEALVLDVWRVARGERADEFEAIIAPPLLAQPSILVSETPPVKPQP